MTGVRLRPFEAADARRLAEISATAFETDVDCGAPDPGGPPGYDSAEWQVRTAEEATAYYVIEARGEIVGGMIVFESRGECWLGRMFVSPTVHGLGVGSQALRLAEAAFPDTEMWSLETPVWNVRTQRFYEKAGYVRMGFAPSGDYLYQKKL